ncbi:iron donor protein CyaY [Paludibacterium paludis]|uniref:Iron-sulfur cluster assembly protein CyaY n=1 Tax=Paludibacterium paludis TaxID=1225769 RepID=A0A918P1I7_9NEIS|nr:iron donor protein CyaY [Paludibacterium paludis]GGY12345.1 protein CyaY [Paludibacterium paludis]
MTESEFLDLTDALLENLQNALDDQEIDVDYALNGGVLELAFDNGAKIIVNRHLPNREMWVAAKRGGFHYAFRDGQWVNTRDGSSLSDMLETLIGETAGAPFRFQA